MTVRKAARRIGAARWAVLLAAWITIPGCDLLGAAPPPDAVPSDAATHERGRTVYNERCYFCHGYSGDAKTLAATYLVPPPRNFTQAPALRADAVVATLRRGRPGTAMVSFSTLLDDAEIRAVAAFVVAEFVRDRARNTAYHTPQNGWPDHERYAAAFPFATGAIELDHAPDAFDAAQRRGRELFLSACVSCHDRGQVADPGPAWRSRAPLLSRFASAPGHAGTAADVDVDPVGASAAARSAIGD